MTPQLAEDIRKRELAQIHIAKNALGMDDDTYRTMLVRVAKVGSSADLNWQQRKKVLDEMRRLGWKNPKFGRRPLPAPDRAKLVQKIEAFLAERKLTWAYADAMAKRICKVEAVQFCMPEQLQKLVAALEYDRRRRTKSQS